MAVCSLCEKEMLEGVSCRPDPLLVGTRLFEPIPWGSEPGPRKRAIPDPTGPCRDCGVPVGGIHHHGCCIESCPSCRRQAIMCGCLEGWQPDPDCRPARSQARCARGRRRRV